MILGAPGKGIGQRDLCRHDPPMVMAMVSRAAEGSQCRRLVGPQSASLIGAHRTAGTRRGRHRPGRPSSGRRSGRNGGRTGDPNRRVASARDHGREPLGRTAYRGARRPHVLDRNSDLPAGVRCSGLVDDDDPVLGIQDGNDVGGGEEQFGYGWPRDRGLQIRRVMTDDEQSAAWCHRGGEIAMQEPALLRRRLHELRGNQVIGG